MILRKRAKNRIYSRYRQPQTPPSECLEGLVGAEYRFDSPLVAVLKELPNGDELPGLPTDLSVGLTGVGVSSALEKLPSFR